MNNAATDGKWENDIAAFEAADRIDPPPKDAIVFVGSSSIRLWKTLSDDFSGLPVINRGFGGSCMHDTLRYADRIVIPYRPRHVVVYAGDNDIAFGGTVELSSLTLVGNGTAGLRRTGGTVNAVNTILWGNGVDSTGAVTLAYSCVSNSTDYVDGGHNVTGNPRFAGAADYRLLEGSSCINQGLNRPWMTGASDLAGERRVMAARVDFGAYEWVPPLGTLVIVH